ncbi:MULTISPECIES: acylphosphatase [Bradyrhizobium]|uniref:acylphosphatase n=1 Tax=Bradyrhizobium arachidis TaxID=858423 RepID=A0AAE7NQV4_9BRAD|nr:MULTISPECIES: acylphosphatase [Bradyrhizobium]QOG20673.1 acylphosphatase [Bradyrhizobium sp. SEMIA]QOZ69972.1 acylphosphatase [Bradyrhizobium arachidis]UFW46093.1 acylphosphatase [Bradyrhizobium arachidis]SFV12413.1 acylphosphatase [Bradyrhizobium arachidis]
MSRAILQVMIRGRVQGVGYRAWVEYQATASGLDGWVRNRRDGSVEALFAGTPKHVADMVALCRHGPPSARVDSVTSETASADELNLRGAGEKFSVLPTV